MITAVVADPSPSFGAQTEAELVALGFAVARAEDLDRAVAIAREVRPGLVVSELRFGQTAGVEVVRQWLPHLEGGSLAIVSAFADATSALAAIQLGAAAVLTKPATGAEILAAVRGAKPAEARAPLTLDEVTRRYVVGVVANTPSLREAARSLGVERTSLRRMLRRYGMTARRVGVP